ncbi:MAG TPA: hypothetical protein VFE46_04130 [Pirellulales bacterium]|jgi:hypothetical protein|nr:hypothetical protein [Pirellulales bacterium]
MLELADTFPDVNVQSAEYKRLLGYPTERVIEGRARELSDWARNWYTEHGRPWVYARHSNDFQIRNDAVHIDGALFSSTRLQGLLQQAQAHAAILVAVSAGQELEHESQKLWHEEKPDEYFFLEVFGSAVVEHLTTMTGARLCAWAESHGQGVLPHYSPGYPEWDVAEQPRLLQVIKHRRNPILFDRLEALETGMLRPKKSLLAVFGLTRHLQSMRKLTDLVPCESCSFLPCQYRRVPYQRASVPLDSEMPAAQVASIPIPAASIPALNKFANYSVGMKALQRWSQERLALNHHADGTIEAVFRYDGTTCTNMGRSLAFDYFVKLGRREQGYPIQDQRCQPAPGDTGHTYMCRYMNNAEHLMVAIERERPLLGQPLNDILSWQRTNDPAGCYCEPSSRKHKWGLVLETIHYALSQQENR